jgi:hypothetical protein
MTGREGTGRALPVDAIQALLAAVSVLFHQGHVVADIVEKFKLFAREKPMTQPRKTGP